METIKKNINNLKLWFYDMIRQNEPYLKREGDDDDDH